MTIPSRIRVFLLALSAALCALTVQSASAAITEPQSYPMACRAGGGMQAQLTMLDHGTAALIIRFKKGTAGAGVRAPGPGECTWLDRGMRPNEPDVLKLYVANAKAIKVNCVRVMCSYVGSANRHLDYLMHAVVGGQPFQVHVYNIENLSNLGMIGVVKRALQGNGFRVTRVGP